MRRLVGLAVLAALAVVVGACASEPEAAGPPTTAADEEVPASVDDAKVEPAGVGEIDWTECEGDECGTLEVPLDYDDPAAGTITLSLSRVPASEPEQRIGALLVNPGGPGGTGTDFARFFPFPDEIRDRFDVIGFDPRGVGASEGLTCGGDLVDRFFEVDPDPDSADEQAALDQSAQAVAADCGTEDGELLNHIGSVNVVRDMDAIRAALGEEQISYLGFSYGTLLGALYADMFPAGARAIVLDGVFDPAFDLTTWLTEQAAGFERAIADVFAACPDDPACPDIGAAAAYDQILATIENEPLPAGGANLLGPGDLATAALYVTYVPDSWPNLYAGLSEALAGDGEPLFQLAEDYRAFGVFTQYAAVSCVDMPHPTGADAYRAFAAQLEGTAPRFGAAVANELLPCAFWPVDEVGTPGPVDRAGRPARARHRQHRRRGHAVRAGPAGGRNPGERGAAHPRGRGPHVVSVGERRASTMPWTPTWSASTSRPRAPSASERERA